MRSPLSQAHALQLKNKLNRTDEALNAIKDVLLMFDSDLFAGMMESNYARVVAELGVALRRFVENPLTITKSSYIIIVRYLRGRSFKIIVH